MILNSNTAIFFQSWDIFQFHFKCIFFSLFVFFDLENGWGKLANDSHGIGENIPDDFKVNYKVINEVPINGSGSLSDSELGNLTENCICG